MFNGPIDRSPLIGACAAGAKARRPAIGAAGRARFPMEFMALPLQGGFGR